MQKELIEVKLNNDSKIINVNAISNINKGDSVVVQTDKGQEIGVVYQLAQQKDIDIYETPVFDVVRVATKSDMSEYENLQKKSAEITKDVEAMVESLNLDMKVVNAETSLDRSKIVINFTSENRVDFRELVKMLGTKLKTRIELRQIGARDEVKIVGGLGPCGQVCCCKKFLNDFEKVSIKMPKVQNLSLNPTKISGLCGRLMCCLAYENEHYSETSKQMPKINSEVNTPDGTGKVIYNNLLKKLVQVKFTDPEGGTSIQEYPLEKIKFFKNDTKTED